MIEIFHVRHNKSRILTPQTVLEVGDSILLAGKEEQLPFVQANQKLRVHILLISPVGTIIDSDQLRLDETGLRHIYRFPITPDLFSGTYFLQIDGDFKRIAKVNVKTKKQLIYRWIFTYGVNIANPNNHPINDFTIDIMIPPNISPIQQITKIDCNFHPSKLISDKEGNRWMRFYYAQLNPNEKITIAYRALIITRLVSYDVTRIKTKERDIEHLYPDTYHHYTKDEPFIDSSNKEIINIARKVSNFSALSKVIAFLKFLRENIQYLPQSGDFGAMYALENRYGDCTEFASLFVSLCRAANVPARLTTSTIQTQNGEWQQHAQAEFFASGIWIPIDPTLQEDIRYLLRNPGSIILQRGNTLGESPIRQIRYFYENISNNKVTINTYSDIQNDKGKIVGKMKEISLESELKTKGTLFENISWKHSIPNLDLEHQTNNIEIRVTAPETAPVHKPFNIPVHLYNRSNEEVTGTLRISFVRGGIYTSHLLPLQLEKNSHDPIMVEIPASNFLGKALIEFIFQDENGGKLGYEQRKIHFQ
ncbi:MAG: transglutaminase family protein [Candidatus Heimdallarchaeota archaeon]|nr:transglutaminase family protein [Candidatus Heimdallarchaeota archaeon]